MPQTEKEMKLIRLALDPAAQPGEISNAAIALIRAWRDRAVKPEELERYGGSSNGSTPIMSYTRPDYGLCVFPFGKKFKGQQFKNIDPGYLRYQLKWIRSDPKILQKFQQLAEDIENFLTQT